VTVFVVVALAYASTVRTPLPLTVGIPGGGLADVLIVTAAFAVLAPPTDNAEVMPLNAGSVVVVGCVEPATATGGDEGPATGWVVPELGNVPLTGELLPEPQAARKPPTRRADPRSRPEANFTGRLQYDVKCKSKVTERNNRSPHLPFD
jgi:hypothetical protein